MTSVRKRPIGNRTVLAAALTLSGHATARVTNEPLERYDPQAERRAAEAVLADTDEVSTISSVSGGSFTAAYYALYADRIFEDFQDRFLRSNFDARIGDGHGIHAKADVVEVAFVSTFADPRAQP